MDDEEPLTWESLLDEGWDRDCRIAALACHPDVDLAGYLTALWERRRWERRGGIDVWVEPHPVEAAEENDQ